MKIAVIGATGGTGKQLLAVGPKAAHTMVALARRPDAISPALAGTVVVKADVLDRSSLAAAFEGVDAVASCLGIGGLLAARNAGTILSSGMSNVVEAMKAAGVRRLVAVSSVGVEDDPTEEFVYRRILKPFFLNNLYADMAVMEAVIAHSRLDWTILRPPLLIDKPATGKFKIQVGGNVPYARRLAREDLARFIIKCVEANQHVNEIVGLSH